MSITPVRSSNLAWVGYDSPSATLEIGFLSGGVYHYYNVPYSEYAGLMDATSHGSYFHARIRKGYRYRRIR